MKVLVTGATGFVGTALVRRLRHAGDAVTTVVSRRWPLALDRVVGDVRDAGVLNAAIERADPDVIYHLAAVATRADALANPPAVFDVNVGGTTAVLAAARRRDAPMRVVLVSTDALSRPRPNADLYEQSKAAAEAAAMCYREDVGLDVVVARLSNVYGPGDTSMQRIVPAATAAAVSETVFEPLGPSSTLDLVHVNDVTAALAQLGAGVGEESVYSVASGTMVTVAAVVQAVRDIALGHGRRAIAVTPYESTMPVVPGWMPATTLEAGLEETVRWYRDRPPPRGAD